MSTNVVLPRVVATTATTAGPLTAGKHSRVDASSGSLTMTLPAAVPGNAGASISVEKADSSTNTVVISGSIRGTASTISLTTQNEAIEFLGDSTGSWYPVAGHRTKSALDAAYEVKGAAATVAAASAPLAAGRVQLARRSDAFGFNAIPAVGYGCIPHDVSANGAAGTGYTSRVPYKAVGAFTDLRVVLPAWYIAPTSAGTETAVPNALTYKAAIEYNGAFYPVTFNGVRKPTIDPWSTIISDPVAIDLAAGDLFAVRLFFDTPASGSYLNGTNTNGSVLYGLSTGYGFSNGDVVDATGAISSVYSQNLPTAMTILGTPLGTAPAVVIGVGDSITYGIGDSSNKGAGGWLTRGMADARPFLNLGTASMQTAAWAGKAARTRYSPFISMGTHAVVLLGINDTQAGANLTTLKANLTAVWTMLANRGLKVYGATLLPATSSTDSWATTTNQTPKTGEAVRTAVNDWIRTTPAPLAGYFETADTVETARNSGIWQVGKIYTTDAFGVHPNAAGHAAMAAAVNLGTLV